jgi:hypothetical protein
LIKSKSNGFLDSRIIAEKTQKKDKNKYFLIFPIKNANLINRRENLTLFFKQLSECNFCYLFKFLDKVLTEHSKTKQS